MGLTAEEGKSCYRLKSANNESSPVCDGWSTCSPICLCFRLSLYQLLKKVCLTCTTECCQVKGKDRERKKEEEEGWRKEEVEGKTGGG